MSQSPLVLDTPRLQLREVIAADWPAVLSYQQTAEYLQFYPWETRSAADVQQFLKMFIDWQQENPRSKYQLAITLSATQQLIGLCGVRKRSANASEAEIGYELAPAYWGRGLATEAAGRLLNFAFTHLHVHRVWATCIPENTGSMRVLERLGLRQEGRLRENRRMKDRWWDTMIYGILDHEWQSTNHHTPQPESASPWRNDTGE